MKNTIYKHNIHRAVFRNLKMNNVATYASQNVRNANSERSASAAAPALAVLDPCHVFSEITEQRRNPEPDLDPSYLITRKIYHSSLLALYHFLLTLKASLVCGKHAAIYCTNFILILMHITVKER